MSTESVVQPVLSSDERVYSAIYNAVQGQRLAPGIKLKEMALAQLFKVSRTSVRNALLRLTAPVWGTLFGERARVGFTALKRAMASAALPQPRNFRCPLAVP